MTLWNDLAIWMRGCPLWHRARRVSSGGSFDTVTKGSVTYGVTMAFVEGTTLQDLLAAGAATCAIWVSRHPDAAGDLDQVTVNHGRYQVDTEVRVHFRPLADDEAVVPIFDGRGLVELLEKSQR